ncbi:putative phage tail protein [Kushneria sinocarnis]|uniref:Putative phage tail protein n=1 Tax=Kushneria sinocarnis TaxID=595502 RepID=A0A420WUQ3_9GAMM|nr:tail assembly protein [Kushneria sinocarnis]RKQ97160.1 putative phage tail protein [Kushneria sinocarnis]
MKDVHLHGSLQDRFGGPFSLDVRDPAEAVRALSCQIKGFSDAIGEAEWQVVMGSLDDGETLDEQTVQVGFGRQREMHILPAIQGAGDGAGKAIAGAALIGASFALGPAGLAIGGSTLLSGATIATMGASLALTGISQALTKTPQTGDYGDKADVEERPSFLFDGPVNNSAQGLPVPIVVGEIKTGSVVISASLTAEKM